MKNLSIITLMIVFCSTVSCSTQDDIREGQEVILDHITRATRPFKKQEPEYKVSLKEALALADIHKLGRQIESVSPYIEAEDTTLYLVKYSKGWIVISGDKRTDSILAESKTGELNLNNNTNFNAWIQVASKGIFYMRREGMPEEINKSDSQYLWRIIDDNIGQSRREEGKDTKSEDPDPDAYLWKRWFLGSSLVSHTVMDIPSIVETKWGQEYPWNKDYVVVYNPYLVTYQNGYVGCVAVAVGQTINKLHHSLGSPNGLYHNVSFTGSAPYPSISRGSYVSNSDRWDYFARDSVGANADADSVKFVREFLIDVADRFNMEYLYNGSWANLSISPFSFYSLTGIQTNYNWTSFQRVVDNVSSGIPVIVGAHLYSNGPGHAWIIDGVNIHTYVYEYHYLWEYSPNNGVDGDGYQAFTQAEAESYFTGHLEDLVDGAEVYTSVTDHTHSYYMNWGFNGRNDDALYSIMPTGWPSYTTDVELFSDFSVL